uniref:Tyr recombinase domain-containing protein n=1 Tax=Thermorudis peleae TaxID=1382356 RepID=A0A831TD28_9BACT
MPRPPRTSDPSIRQARPQARGPPRVRFHDLQHTTASLLLGQGVHPKVVASLLGHSTIQITLDTYSHVTPGPARDAAATFGKLVASKIASNTAAVGPDHMR